MDQKKPVSAMPADPEMFQQIQKVSLGKVLSIDEGMDHIVHFLRLGAAEGVKLPFPDQKTGDAFSQIGVFAHLVRRAADAYDSHKGTVVKDRQVDPLLVPANRLSVSTSIISPFSAACFPIS